MDIADRVGVPHGPVVRVRINEQAAAPRLVRDVLNHPVQEPVRVPPTNLLQQRLDDLQPRNVIVRQIPSHDPAHLPSCFA